MLMNKIYSSALVFALAGSAFSTYSFAGEIHKWKDEKGVTHFGERPPAGQKTEVIGEKKESETSGEEASGEINSDFLLGRWQSEEYTAFGTTIPAQVYFFTKTIQGVEGKPMSMPVKSYSVQGSIITVEGGISQKFTVIDRNTVSYDTGGAGIKKLRRL